jgi:DNA repair protein RadC
MPVLGWKCRERAAVLIMDVHHKWLATEVISIGSKTECLFHPDAVFTAALKHGGKRIIIAHNHPSGNLATSPEDVSLTRVMVKAGF